MTMPTHEELANALAKQILGMLKQGELQLPSHFLVPSILMGDLVLVAKRIVKERSLSKGLHVSFTECVTSLLENSKSMTDDDMDTVIAGLSLAEKESKWDHDSNQDWYEFI